MSEHAAVSVTMPVSGQKKPGAELQQEGRPPMRPTERQGPAKVLPFPPVRRQRLIARLRRSKPGEYRNCLRLQARMLQRAGISEEEICRQLRSVIAAAQYGMLAGRTGGAA